MTPLFQQETGELRFPVINLFQLPPPLLTQLFPAPLFLLLLLTACTDHASQQEAPAAVVPHESAGFPAPLDQALAEIVQQQGLSGDPVGQRKIPNINSALAQLGKQLFYSARLSGDKALTCASCHNPLLGGGDNLSLAIGLDYNSPNPHIPVHGRWQRNGHIAAARNAPTTFNTALWDQVMFHDGRIESLEKHPGVNGSGTITTPDVIYPAIDPLAGDNLVQAQARFPVDYCVNDTDTTDCRQSAATRLGARIKTFNAGSEEKMGIWLDKFRQAFNAPDGLAHVLITEQNISKALSEYERSQVFTDTPWKHYVNGDTAIISDKAKQGALLFFKKPQAGGFACVRCHSGDFFTDESFYNTLIPAISPGSNRTGKAPANLLDYGRCLTTGLEHDKFTFRTPSLLNTEVTGPWGHNGAYTSLANIVRHMLNPYQMALHYDRSQLLQSGLQNEYYRENLREMLASDVDLTGQNHTESDVQALVAFLLTLTDPCVKDPACLQPWLGEDSEPQTATP